METYKPDLSPDEFEHLSSGAAAAAIADRGPVVGVDFTAETPHPKVTVWRAAPDGTEYADVPMASPEDLERLKQEVPLTEAQVAQLARKIAKQMLKDTRADKIARKRIANKKAAKLARRRGR